MAEEIIAKVEIPEFIQVRRKEVFEIPKHAVAVGLEIHKLNWPRRRIVNWLQFRMECYLDAGGVYRDHEGVVFGIHEDSIDQTFSDDPGYKWLSNFPGRCSKEPDWNYNVEDDMRNRFQILDAALRTPLTGDAI